LAVESERAQQSAPRQRGRGARDPGRGLLAARSVDARFPAETTVLAGLHLGLAYEVDRVEVTRAATVRAPVGQHDGLFRRVCGREGTSECGAAGLQADVHRLTSLSGRLLPQCATLQPLRSTRMWAWTTSAA